MGSKEVQKVNKMYPRSGKGVGADSASGVESGIQLVIRIIVFSGCGSDKMLSIRSSEWNSTLCTNSGWELRAHIVLNVQEDQGGSLSTNRPPATMRLRSRP